MKHDKPLPRAEWEVLNGVWSLAAHSPLGVTVRATHEFLYPKAQKALTTVQTVMGVLAKKGYLKKTVIGRVGFYEPSVSPEKVLRKEVTLFVAAVFNGSPTALAGYLVASGMLSQEDIRRAFKSRSNTPKPPRTTRVTPT